MGLSFILMSLLSATLLQAFAARVALCSASIGTTSTILSTTGLAKTRLGVILGNVAVMDNVMGLVMLQLSRNLGLRRRPRSILLWSSDLSWLL